MKLFKVEEGVLINCENIEALEMKDQLHTRIYMRSGKTFTADYPFETLSKIIEKIDDSGKEVLKSLNAVLKTTGNFAG
jgi:hypothetical protein